MVIDVQLVALVGKMTNLKALKKQNPDNATENKNWESAQKHQWYMNEKINQKRKRLNSIRNIHIRKKNKKNQK